MIDPKQFKIEHATLANGVHRFRAGLIMFAEQNVQELEFAHLSHPLRVEAHKEMIFDELKRAIWVAIYEPQIRNELMEVRELIIVNKRLENLGHMERAEKIIGNIVDKLTYKRPPIVHANMSGVNPSVNGDKNQ